jgi:hypothetical protein
LFIGEFGPYIDGRVFTRENVVPKLQAFLDFVQKEEGIAGTMLWSMYFHHRDGGFYWHQIFTYPAVWSYHWPGFPSAAAQQERAILAGLRRAAFALEGKPEPPLPVPSPPELLPIGDTPLISWRGSAGASGYDLHRAAEPSGPWTTIARNVSDADVAYRPLYSDTSAAAGQTWHYRVLARNGSGVSEPSNVVGPVHVRQVCLADELQNLDLAEEHSPGLKLSNDYNARYAEYLFRVQGNQDDWIRYRVPREIRSLRVWAWRTDEASTLGIQVSADGQTWIDLPATPRARSFKAPPTGRKESGRTLLDYDVPVSTPATQMRLVWRGPVELDRVEIYHSGVPTSRPAASK